MINQQWKRLSNAQDSITSTKEKIKFAGDASAHAGELISTSREALSSTARQFNNLESALERLEKVRGRAGEAEEEVTSTLESHRVRHVLPCQDHAESLSSSAARLQATFEDHVGDGGELALRAAESYRRIAEAARAAQEATLAAMRNALELIDVDGEGQGDFLRERAEAGRVRSEDLSQEAHGLKQNAADMGHRVDGLRQRWRERSALMMQYAGQLEEMRWELDRLPQLGDPAREALFSANEALAEAERTFNGVLQMASRIREELYTRVEEMKSFSPKELSNIPKHCNVNVFVLFLRLGTDHFSFFVK